MPEKCRLQWENHRTKVTKCCIFQQTRLNYQMMIFLLEISAVTFLKGIRRSSLNESPSWLTEKHPWWKMWLPQLPWLLSRRWTSIVMEYWWNINGSFLSHGATPSHPLFKLGCSMKPSSYWGSPGLRTPQKKISSGMPPGVRTLSGLNSWKLAEASWTPVAFHWFQWSKGIFHENMGWKEFTSHEKKTDYWNLSQGAHIGYERDIDREQGINPRVEQRQNKNIMSPIHFTWLRAAETKNVA